MVYSKSILLTISIWFLAIHITWGQSDNSFWFAAPDLQVRHGDDPIYLRLSTGEEAAKVVISIPANPAFQPIEVQLPAYRAYSVDLTPFKSMIECDATNLVQRKGIYIQASCAISCYYDIADEYNGDLFSLKGDNALGQRFTIPFQMGFVSGGGYGYPAYTANFIVLATADSTEVTVIPTKNIVGHAAGVPFTVLLHKGETYSVQSLSTYASERAGGTQVLSNKPIAITLKDDSIQLPGFGCADTAGDQLIPDELAGTHFIIPKGRFYSPDRYYVYALTDSTRVFVKGELKVTLEKYTYYEGQLNEPAAYVQTSAPCQVFHISGFGCEIGGAVIPGVQCTGSTSVHITRATSQDFFLNIIVSREAVKGFLLNGKTTAISSDNFFPVLGTDSTWWCARLNIPIGVVPAGEVAHLTNTLGRFHLGIIHGDQSSTSRYGYFSDFSNTEITLENNTQSSCTDINYCLGALISLTAKGAGITRFYWEGPHQFFQEGAQLYIPDFKEADEGFYTLYAEGGACGKVKKRIFLTRPLSNPLHAGMAVDSPVQCLYKNAVTLRNLSYSEGGVAIRQAKWQIGNTISNQLDSLVYMFPDTGTYVIRLLVTDDHHCTDSVEQRVQIIPSPIVAVEADTRLVFCAGDSVTLNGHTSDTLPAGSSLQWYNNGLPVPEAQYLQYTAYQSGTYRLEITFPNGCQGSSADLPVTVYPIPSVRLYPPASSVLCGNQQIQLQASGSGLLQWYLNGVPMAGVHGTLIHATKPGIYTVASTAPSGCMAWADTVVVLTASTKPTVQFEATDVCVGQEVSFQNTSPAAPPGITWYWDFGDGTNSSAFSPAHLFQKPGRYTVVLRARSAVCPDLEGRYQQPLLVEEPITGIQYPPVYAARNLPTPLQSRALGAQVWWSPGVYLDDPSSGRPIFNGADNQTYLIQITSKNGCMTTDTQAVWVADQVALLVPTAFTPNRDGENDVLQFFLVGVHSLEVFRVFSRWGQLMFETTTPGDYWDGTFNGQEQPVDTYVWIAKGIGSDGKPFNLRGQTALIR